MLSAHERTFFERLTIPLVLCSYTDEVLTTEAVSDGVCIFTGVSREELMEAFVRDLFADVHPQDVGFVKNTFQRFLTEHIDLDVIYRYRQSHSADYLILHAVVKWQPMEDGSEMILICFNDMKNTESGIEQLYKSAQERTDDILFRDMTTGLPNMVSLWQLANKKIKNLKVREKNAAVIYFDILSMHSYNTQYGYEKGNELMKLIAEKISEEFDSSLLGRGSDDHFVLLDEFISEDEIQNKIDMINSSVRKEAYGSTDGIRAGVYVIESDTDAVRGLDLARRALKDIGDDMSITCSFYSMVQDDIFWRERYIIENFETALDNEWIKVFYQPIIRAETDQIAALEALSRWIDPVRGTIPPNDFIPVLSRHHLLYRLDLYMAEHVCREFRTREEAGLPLVPVSVNFSAQDFDHINVPGKLREIVERNGRKPDDIIVEITEQDIARGAEEFRLQVGQIRENGHKLWIDDFGSGYSSLNVLNLYKADRIKFDMDIIRHLDDNNGANRKILKAMVDVCKELGMHTLSEGVETREQLDFLKSIGCGLIQGFYFFRPAALVDIIYRVRQGGNYMTCES